MTELVNDLVEALSLPSSSGIGIKEPIERLLEALVKYRDRLRKDNALHSQHRNELPDCYIENTHEKDLTKIAKSRKFIEAPYREQAF